jgi:hypothetical protein
MKTHTNPQFPGKPFRRLEVGEIKQEGDYIDLGNGSWALTQSAGDPTPEHHEMCRALPKVQPISDPSALMLQRIEEVIQKLDAVLAKLNA